jgi:hypothetical protein
MKEVNDKTGAGSGGRDRILTAAVLIVSLTGILYFGIRAFTEFSRSNRDNAYTYDLASFRESGGDRVRYTEERTIGLSLDVPTALAIGPGDILYVAGDESLLELDEGGDVRSSLPVSAPVRCLAVDGNSDIYAGLDDCVEVFRRDGTLKSRWKSMGEKAILTSIICTPEYVFVADAGDPVVWRFDKSGNRGIRIGDGDPAKDIPGFVIPSAYFDVAVDPDGFLWVADTGRHSMENYTLDGGMRSSWGEFSMDIEGFCGCCNPSHFSILENGWFVTSEKGIPRVKVYDRLGRMAAVVAGPDLFDEGAVGLDLAVDSSQRIHVLDPARRAVRIFVERGNE